MMKNAKRLLSMLLVLSMVLGVAPLTAWAAPNEETTATAEAITETGSFDLSAIKSVTPLNTDGVEVDEDDPVIIAVEEELNEMKVLNADGETVGLTEEQKAQALGLFQQYLDQWEANANVLGVQVPFFLQYNDNGEDGLGILGEMLAMQNGLSVDIVRAGYMSFDDLTGMIMNFYYGDQLGIQYYGNAIASARNEIMDLIEESGAQTEEQKMLVVNNWLAQNVTFDMSYIMNADKDTNGDGVIDANDDNVDSMVAENPQQHENYQGVYNTMYDVYEPQIEQMFRSEIEAGIRAQLEQKFYEEAIKGMIQEQAVEAGVSQAAAAEGVVDGAVAAYRQEQYDAALKDEEERVYNEAYNAYIAENHEHSFTSVFAWEEVVDDEGNATGEYTATVTVTCTEGDEVYEDVEATVTKVATESKAPTCTEAGVNVFTANATVEGVTVTQKKEVTVEALGHTFDENGVCTVCGATSDTHEHAYTATFEWTEVATGGYSGATADVVCGTCEETHNDVTATVTKDDDSTEATCTEAGADIYTAAVLVDEKTFTDTKTVEVAALGHNYVDGVCSRCEEPQITGGEENQTVAVSAALAAAAEAAAKEAVEAAAENTKTVATKAADDAVAALTDAEKTELAKDVIRADETAMAQINTAAKTAAADFMKENSEAIAAGARDFLVGMLTEQLGEETAAGYMAQIDAQYDAFIELAETEGVEVDPVNAPGVKMTITQLVDQQMNSTDAIFPMGTDAQGNTIYMTPADAIAAATQQAAAGLTDGIINYWQGSHFGALGRGSAVCLGYTKAFTYLVQYMNPAVYGVNGANTDMSVSKNWKTKEELYYDANGNLDITQNYVVDAVRITFDASVTMYGQTQDNFNSDHFWNAVQIDGQWYYVDPCYVDVYTEVMMRDRVETDGSMNHMYFLFSHTTAIDLYEGNYKEIKTLYDTAATHTDYEDSWIARIKSNPCFDSGYAYYIYDSTDLITVMEDYENDNLAADAMENGLYKLVRHKLDTTDAGTDGDRDYETLIEFNYKADEDDDESIARVYNPDRGVMVENVLLTKLYAQHVDDGANYPSLAITAALYNGKLYFNLSNVLLSYNLEDGDVDIVKEYNTVHGLRDDTNPFGGMAFSVVDSADEADFTVYNHPIAGISLKDDGNLYVSIATNFAFISGKDPHNSEDQSSYGYEFEESNYNPNYSSYGSTEDNDLYESFGYTEEINDNDEFMWSANFVETLSMSHLAGSRHSYEEVSIEAACGRNAYTENRCTTCGASEDDTRVEVEDTATAHHYVYFEEEFYTVANNGNWNTGSCYVCTECGFSISEPVEPEENSLGEQFGGMSYEEQMEAYEEELAIYEDAVATAGHSYEPTDVVWAEDNSSVTFSELQCSAICPERQPHLDCLLNDNTITLTLEEEVEMEASIVDTIGTCPEGLIQVYQASGEVELEIIEDKPETFTYTATKEVVLDPTNCKFEGGFCPVCGDCTVKRISGTDRCETAFKTANVLKETLGVEKFETIILASGYNFADALAGSYLASVKDAPILLHTDSAIEKNVTYITENLAEDGIVYILGGSAAVSQDMETALTDAGIEVDRLSGSSRFDTNLVILEEAGVSNEEVLIATGWNFADSLSASATGLPILMVNSNTNELTEKQIEFLEDLDRNNFTIIGGTGAVSETLEAAIEEIVGKNVARIYGKGREATSVAVAEKYFDEPSSILLAYSWNFPDGLCGGPLAYTMGAPLILTSQGAEAAATEYVVDTEVTGGLILGGTAAVAEETAKTVFGITSDLEIPKL